MIMKLPSQPAKTGPSQARYLYDREIVLCCLLRKGRSVTYVANARGVNRKTVVLWRGRYEQIGQLKRNRAQQESEKEKYEI
jgi:transposase